MIGRNNTIKPGRYSKAAKRIGPAGIITAVVVLCLLISGCKTEETGENVQTSPPKSVALTPVACRLKWLYNASVAGEIWADSQGIFKKYGIKPLLLEGGPEQDAIKDLELGRVMFGVASADQVIRAASKGAGVVVLAQIFQKNPLQWIYPESRFDIKTPMDLKGRRIGVTYGGNDEAILLALLKKYDISTDDVELYAVHYDYNPFWKGRVDLWPVYRNVEGIILSEKMAKNGMRAGFFDPGEAGIRFVANSLITSKTVYEKRPELVRKFTMAVLEGWEKAMTPLLEEKAAEAIHRLDPETPVRLIRRQIVETRKMVVPEDASPIGTIDSAAWEQTADIMLARGLLSTPVDVSSLLAPPLP